MRILSAPLQPPVVRAAPAPPTEEPIASDVIDGKKFGYKLGPDGNPIPLAPDAAPSYLDKLKGYVLPENYPRSVREDYSKVRFWLSVHDNAASVASMAANMAYGAAMDLAFPGSAALIGYSINYWKNWLTTPMSMHANRVTTAGERNPKAWMVTGDIAENSVHTLWSLTTFLPAGVLAMGSSVMPGGMLLPMGLAGAAVASYFGGFKGSAMQQIDNLHAVADNLSDVRNKNGNQWTLAQWAMVPSSILLCTALQKAIGPVAFPLVAATFGGLAVFAQTRAVKALKYNPLNEAALKTIIDGMEKNNGEVPKPVEKSVPGLIMEAFEKEEYELGAALSTVSGDPQRYAELKGLYKGGAYILEVKDGKPLVVLDDGIHKLDILKAGYQCVQVGRLKETPEYQTLKPEEKDRWLVQESLKRLPTDMQAFADKCEQAGWTAEFVRLKQTSTRTEKLATILEGEDLSRPPTGGGWFNWF